MTHTRLDDDGAQTLVREIFYLSVENSGTGSHFLGYDRGGEVRVGHICVNNLDNLSEEDLVFLMHGLALFENE